MTGGFARVWRREWAALRASPWDLALLTWLPLGVCALLVWIFSAGSARDLPIAVIDQDHSALSRQLLRALDASPGLRVAAQVERPEQALALLRRREVWGVLTVPEGSAAAVLSGRAATLPWQVDAQFLSHAGTLTRDVRAVVGTLSAALELGARGRRGAAPAVARAQMEPIRLRLGQVLLESGHYEAFLGLATLPAVAHIFITLAAVSAIGRELRDASVPDWLAAAGGHWGAALAGKLAPPALLFGGQALLYVAVMGGLRGWPVQGGPAGLAAVLAGLAALVAVSLALGLALVGLTLSLRLALSGAAFVTAPAFAYAGQGWPVQAMPALARTWAEWLPLTHGLRWQTRHWWGDGASAWGAPEPLVLLALATVGLAALGTWRLQRHGLQPASWGRR